MMSYFTPFDTSFDTSTPQETQAALQRDGFLFFKSALPPAALRLVHRAFSDAAYEGGWAQDRGSDDRPPVANMQAACASPDPSYLGVYHELYRNELFHCLTHLSEIEELARCLIGEEAIVHPRIVGRIIFPRRPDFTTPPHQDFFQVRGTPSFVTFWIPLHDCSVSHGSLRIARGSHTSGLLPVVPSPGASGATIDVHPDEFDWFSGDFERGDLVAFSGMTVHMAGQNDTDLLRFSVDMRWQSRREPVSERSLEFSPLSDLGWDSVTAGWGCDKHLAWRTEDLNIEPYSSEVTKERDMAALELARKGDIATSLASLQRIATYDDDEERRNEASRLLEQLRHEE
jgi:hypothetical protein